MAALEVSGRDDPRLDDPALLALILGPGGFRFGDYWRLGLPLEILIVTLGVPALLMFWPL